MNLLGFEDSVLASSPVSADLVTTPRSRSNKSSVGTSWHTPRRALHSIFLVALIAPWTISAAPLKAAFDYKHVLDSVHVYRLGRRAGNNDNNGGIPFTTWLPILVVAIALLLVSFIICIRRFVVPGSIPSASTPSNGASGTRATNNATAPRTRRRPRRTPSQISTKSLPPYMKEPGEEELVLYRGPAETEDDHPPPGAMPTLAEADEHPELHDATFNISLERVESHDTMADASTTHLIRRPPELHHANEDVAPRRSEDVHSLGSSTRSHGSSADLLLSHQRTISADVPDPRGEAPSYTEAVSAEANVPTISLNDPEPNNAASVARGVDSAAGNLASRGSRSRFSFLLNPFNSNNAGSSSSHAPPPPPERAPSPAIQPRSDHGLSRVSSNESHVSEQSRTRSGNHSRSQSGILRAFRSQTKLPVSTSAISLDSISAPLTHTATRAEFYAPKGGLLTAEQIKLITSREALDKFGVPYGPDAVAAFSLSRDQLLPPPDFDSVTGEHGQMSTSGSGGTGTTSSFGEGSRTVAQSSDFSSISASSRSQSPGSRSHLSPSPHPDMRAGSRASTVVTYATAFESVERLDDDQSLYLQAVQAYASDSETDEDDAPLTARPVTPTTARPSSLAGGRGSVA